VLLMLLRSSGGGKKDPISSAADFDLQDFGDSKRGSESGIGKYFLHYVRQYTAGKIIYFVLNRYAYRRSAHRKDCAEGIAKGDRFLEDLSFFCSSAFVLTAFSKSLAKL